MADEFDDAIDGRLVIATDDERMDCTESAILTREDKESGGSSVGPNASPKELSKTELDNLAAPDGSHSTEDDGKNCCKDEPHLLVSNIALNSKYIANETTESTADGLDKLQKQTELVKWEELEGGIVPPVTGSKLFENERVPRSFDFVAKGHLSNEMNKSLALPNSQHGVHNFLHGGGDSKKKKLMVDKGTCVLSRPTGTHGLDEHLLAMRPGTNLTIDITIICKAGSNTLYISAKWKGREYHGVLTDGEPLFSHTYAQKRSAAQNAEKFVFESGAGNNGGTANQKAQNSEKAGGGGMSGKRGGKRGVGGHPKGGSGEKRAKNNQIESQSGADAEDEAAKSSKSEDKMRTDSGERAAEGTELGGDRQLTEEKPLGNPHGHNQHLHQQHHRRRTSSSASSGVCVVPSKNGLYDGDAASRIRCQHKQCGHRFETANELNAHLLIGTHGVAGEKAKIFESTASQTSSVQFVSVGCDPCFSSKVLVSNNTKSNLFCAKCQKELAPENGDNHSDEVKRPQLLECDDSVEKSKPKVVATDNSPGFSDISDDAAPTLEKEESFDKQGDEAKKVPPLSALAASSVPSSSHTPDRTDAVAAGDPSTSAHQPNACGKNVSSQSTGDNKNGIEIPSKSVAVSIIRQNLLTNANNTKNGEESAANGAIKPPTKKTSSSSIALTLAKTPTTTMATGAIGESSNDSNNNNNSSANTNPYFMTSTSEMAAANAVASGFPFNHFLSFGPHLSHQAFVSALAQGAAQIGVVPSSAPSASSLVPSSSALAAGLKLMSPPSAAGLLSLGTPLTASANQMPNCSGAPSKSAEPPAISQPIQHKIYELQQQQQSGALLGRSSSTKPSTSGVGHVQSANVGTPGAMGGGANAISSADMALMRPNSAISAVGYHSQQQLQNSQMHSAVPQVPPQQANRQCPPGAPSPIGSVGVSTAVGPFVHHLPAPPLHHPFLPPLSSLIAGAGAQFGIPAGSAAAPNILAAAAAQQQQQQMAAFRRNNNANAGQSSASTNQQQAVAAAQHHNPSLMAPFVPQGLSPGMLAMASNFDLNALQHYAAALIASAPSSDAFGNAPPSGQQQQQPTQK